MTRLLLAWRGGDASALEELIPLVYPELRRVARRCLRGEHAQTLQTTALVNEAYLRLRGVERIDWRDRAHFFAVIACLMRRVLVDAARRRRNQKRGGSLARVSLADAEIAAGAREVDLLALDEALTRLAHFAPRKGRVVELRFFGGLTVDETAEALGVSADVVKREWRTARLWLLQDLHEAGDGSGTLRSD